MDINFKQPKYVLPLLALPFLCLFFYVYHSSAPPKKPGAKQVVGLNSSVGDVSTDIQKQKLADKLDAYRDAYKEADGSTAVNIIPNEISANPTFKDNYTTREKKTLDSIDRSMKAKYAQPQVSERDQALAGAINSMAHRSRGEPPVQPVAQPEAKPEDPMDVFKRQMAYMDSINKENDPAYKSEKTKQEKLKQTALEKYKEVKLDVVKAQGPSADFNTVKPPGNNNFIMAIIDENVTGYASSRLRLKLLEDIKAGNSLIPKGTYIYALISGFSGQRVTLEIKSILCDGKILPVKLDVYDLDGLPGLYVPESAFRDFTKDLGTNSIQGVDIGSGTTNFVMSTASKMFESTSSAIADAIRKNKAKMKYNSYLYLIDPDALQKAQTSEALLSTTGKQ